MVLKDIQRRFSGLHFFNRLVSIDSVYELSLLNIKLFKLGLVNKRVKRFARLIIMYYKPHVALYILY